jgi:hypothetical protein
LGKGFFDWGFACAAEPSGHARTNEFTGFASDSLIKGETVALRHTVCKADDGGGGEVAEAVAE